MKQIEEQIVGYLDTVDEISSCSIDISSFAVILKNINNSPLSITTQTASIFKSKEGNRFDEILATLIESDIKEQKVIEISLQLDSIFKPFESDLITLDNLLYPCLLYTKETR